MTRLFRQFLQVWTLTAVFAGCITFQPAHAQDVSLADRQCTKLSLLVGIVDIVSLMVQDSNRHIPSRFQALDGLAGELNDHQLHRMLEEARVVDQYPKIQKYVSDVKHFLAVRRVNGPAFGDWIFNTASFKSNHEDMKKLIKDLCSRSPTEEVFTLLDRIVEQLGLGGSLDPQESQRPEAKKIAPITATDQRWSKPFRVRKEVLMLAQVFFLLAAVVLTIFLVNLGMKFLTALRLDRFSCEVPIVVEVGSVEIKGHIDVLGKMGVSFVAADPDDPINTKHLVLGRHVKFMSEVYDFYGVLTKDYDGAAGFRLSVPLRRDQVRAILKLSEVTPRRKMEMRKKKNQRRPFGLRWLNT